jgi:hypothetical protein
MVVLPIEVGAVTARNKTVKFVLETSEMSPDKIAFLVGAHGKFGYCVLKLEQYTDAELAIVDELPNEFENSKSQSQRLRNALYVTYTQKPEGYTTFQEYYFAKMEKFINHVKSQMQ